MYQIPLQVVVEGLDLRLLRLSRPVRRHAPWQAVLQQWWEKQMDRLLSSSRRISGSPPLPMALRRR